MRLRQRRQLMRAAIKVANDMAEELLRKEWTPPGRPQGLAQLLVRRPRQYVVAIQA